MQTQVNNKKQAPPAIEPIAPIEPIAIAAIEPIEAITEAEAKAAATQAAAEKTAMAVMAIAHSGRGAAADRIRVEVAQIVREETARGGAISADGARIVAAWIYRNAMSANDAIVRRAQRLEIMRAFRVIAKAPRDGAREAVIAMAASGSVAIATAQGAAAAAAAKVVECRRAEVIGDKAAAAAAAAAAVRPAFGQLANLANCYERKQIAFKAGHAPRRDVDAARGRVVSFLGAVERLIDWSEAEADVVEEARALIA